MIILRVGVFVINLIRVDSDNAAVYSGRKVYAEYPQRATVIQQVGFTTLPVI